MHRLLGLLVPLIDQPGRRVSAIVRAARVCQGSVIIFTFEMSLDIASTDIGNDMKGGKPHDRCAGVGVVEYDVHDWEQDIFI